MALPVPHRDQPIANFDERRKGWFVNDDWHRFLDLIGSTLLTAFGTSDPSGAVGTGAYASVATVAEVRSAATGSKLLAAEHLESAAANVVLTDAATVAVDWTAAALNFSLTITDSRVLGNPTNGIPGQTRAIIVQSDAGPDEITFGNQYGGEKPTLNDITTTKWYKLYLECVTTSHFLVSAKDASPP